MVFGGFWGGFGGFFKILHGFEVVSDVFLVDFNGFSVALVVCDDVSRFWMALDGLWGRF